LNRLFAKLEVDVGLAAERSHTALESAEPRTSPTIPGELVVIVSHKAHCE
jgi:hypothetical protein